MHIDLATALLNVLMYFPCQEARELASRMIAGRRAPRDELRRVLALIDREDWHNVQATEVLRKYAREKPVARRVTRREHRDGRLSL